MRIHRHATAAEFLGKAEPWLLGAEAENNLVLGIADDHRREVDRDVPAAYWATVEAGGEIVGCAVRTPPYNVVITEILGDAAPTLVADIRDALESVPGVVGPIDDASRLADVWCEDRRGDWSINVRLRIHSLSSVQLPNAPPPGALRKATESDIDIARNWMAEFGREAGVRHTSADLAERLLVSGRLYFWEHGGPCAMVGIGRETPNGVCISAVYTPPERRRRGYASIATAELSQRFLDSGKRFCCLYTDLDYQTSNAIYHAIGYRPVQDALDIAFP